MDIPYFDMTVVDLGELRDAIDLSLFRAACRMYLHENSEADVASATSYVWNDGDFERKVCLLLYYASYAKARKDRWNNSD